MKRLLTLAIACTLLTACKKDVETTTETTTDTAVTEKPALAFSTKEYNKKTTLPCKGDVCTYVAISVPEAAGIEGVSDSINHSIFKVARSIVYFGEQPTGAKSYKELMDSFIASYDDLAKKYPADAMPWEAKIKATIDYQSDSIINIKLNNYMFTGGAHGYEGNRSLLFSATTGKILTYNNILHDKKAFTAFAEKKFREKFKIPSGKSINATGLFFENDRFILPQNIFYKENGLLLYYNSVEIGSFADGPKELLLPYAEIEQFLRIK